MTFSMSPLDPCVERYWNLSMRKLYLHHHNKLDSLLAQRNDFKVVLLCIPPLKYCCSVS